jgi:hypothetical protein
MKMEITIGCDPEVFVSRRGLGPVPARSVVGNLGTKDKPYDFGDDTQAQIDGLALEFNITPANIREEFIARVKTAMKNLNGRLPEDAYLFPKPSVVFTPEAIALADLVDLELGCNPDFNAYTGKANRRPKDPGGIRSAAGHIHIGWTANTDPLGKGHMQDCIDVVKQLDYALQEVMWLTSYYTHSRQSDIQRRNLYGKAGCFRPKSYGVEYRVPSNTWLCSPGYVGLIFDAVNQAIQDLAAGDYYPERFDYTPAFVRERINQVRDNYIQVGPAFQMDRLNYYPRNNWWMD